MELAIIIIFCVMLIAMIIITLKCYKKCPADQIMVITGAVGKNADGHPRPFICQHGGSRFIMPFLQNVNFLSLIPFTIPIDLRNALTKENIRVNVPASFTVAVSTDPDVMQTAAERLPRKDLKVIKNLTAQIIYEQLRLAIAQFEAKDLYEQRQEFETSAFEKIDPELSKLGLKLINANITDIADESGYFDALRVQTENKRINEVKMQTALLMREQSIKIAETEYETKRQLNEIQNNSKSTLNE